MCRAFALAAVISALVASPAWALLDMYMLRCTSPEHGHDGFRWVFRGGGKRTESEACKALVERMKQHPGHEARLYFELSGGDELRWDCVRHVPVER